MAHAWKFLAEYHQFENLPQEDIPEIVFWGRSNVGKSSLINSVTKSKIAKISKTPGRTRSLVYFELEKQIRFVDFPGYGYSKIPKMNEYKLDTLIELYLSKRRNIMLLFLLIDSKHGFKEIDKIILNQLDQVLKNKIFIIFTKTDRLKNQKDKNLLIEYNQISEKQFNKKFFNTSIKDINTIILLKKFVMKFFK